MDNTEKLLDFYEVDAEYIAYLLKFDKRVPYVDYSEKSNYDKFLCGIVLSINGHDYFAPVSSFKKPQRTNFIIQNEQGEAVSSIRFSFMVPVPSSVITAKIIKDVPSPEYRRLLNEELRFCQANSNVIRRTAKNVYNTVTGNKDPMMVKNCCDFKKLEEACAAYIKENEKATDKPPKKLTIEQRLAKGKERIAENDKNNPKNPAKKTDINRD